MQDVLRAAIGESGDAAGASMGVGLENLDDKEANVRAKEMSSGG